MRNFFLSIMSVVTIFFSGLMANAWSTQTEAAANCGGYDKVTPVCGGKYYCKTDGFTCTSEGKYVCNEKIGTTTYKVCGTGSSASCYDPTSKDCVATTGQTVCKASFPSANKCGNRCFSATQYCVDGLAEKSPTGDVKSLAQYTCNQKDPIQTTEYTHTFCNGQCFQQKGWANLTKRWYTKGYCKNGVVTNTDVIGVWQSTTNDYAIGCGTQFLSKKSGTTHYGDVAGDYCCYDTRIGQLGIWRSDSGVLVCAKL